MPRNSNSATLDVAAFIASQKQRMERVAALQKEQSGLNKEEASLRTRQQKNNAELQALLSGGNFTAPIRRSPAKAAKPVKATKKVARKNGTAKVARKAKPAKVAKSNGTRGITTRDALLQALPTPDQDGISKDAAVAAIVALGWKSGAGDPKVVVGQTLGKFKDFTAPARGIWRLTATGIRNRDKANAAPVAQAAPTPEPVVAPATEPEAPASAPSTDAPATVETNVNA